MANEFIVKNGLIVNGISTSNSFVKLGGTSAQFLKADGSADSTTYLTGTKVDSFNTRTGAVTLTTADVNGVAATVLGAVTTGTWNATTISVGKGGTGVTTLTGIPYGNGTSAFSVATGAQIATAIGTTTITNATNATKWTTARTITIGSTGKSVDGSSNISWSLAEIGAASSTHNHTIDSLSNVTITSNTSGELLKWNGTAWINNTLSEAGIQAQINGTGFVKANGTTISYDNTTYVPASRTLTINGTTYDLSTDRSWTISGGLSGTLSTDYIPKATSASSLGNSLIRQTNDGVVHIDTDIYPDEGILNLGGLNSFSVDSTFISVSDTFKLKTWNGSGYDEIDMYAGNFGLGNQVIIAGGINVAGTTVLGPYGGGPVIINSDTDNGYGKLQVNGEGTINNVRIGRSNSSEVTNTIVGVGSLQSTIGSGESTAVGYNALLSNLNGWGNTAIGHYSQRLSTGDDNTSLGNFSLQSNTSGGENIAVGGYALYSNNIGYSNTATGFYTLYGNTSGNSNVGLGLWAGGLNSTGSYNVSLGAYALYAKTTGDYNIGLGYQAGQYIANKSSSNTNSTGSIFLGYRTSPLAASQTNQIVIGYDATGNGSNTVTIGNSSITDNYFKGNIKATGDVVAFYSSDKNLKDNIEPITNSIDKIKKIGGYEFDWNDKQSTYEGHDIGVIAQEIEEILPELVITRDNGYKAVKYEKITALLIEGIKEQQSKIDEQQKQIDELKQIVNQLLNNK